MNYSTKWFGKKKNSIEGSRSILSFILIMTTLAGRVSLIVFVVFLFGGSLNLVQFEFTERAMLAWNALLSVTFFVQHSGMIRRSFRSRFSKIDPNALLWNSLHDCIRHRAYNSNGFLAIIPNLTIRASKSFFLARARSFFSGDGGKRLGCVHSTIIRAIWCRFHQGSIEWKAGSASGVHCPRSLFVGSPSSLFLRDRDDMVMSRSGC